MTTALTPEMRKRHLRPIAELAAGRPHGDRLRYMAGCRCADCRKANSAYECARQKARRNGDWNGIVPATKARRHLKKLAAQGVGRRAVGAVTDISQTILHMVRNGKKSRIRARTERKILAVTIDQAADGANIPAGPSKALIAALIAEGYTASDLAKRLGYKHRALQFTFDQISVRNAGRIRRLHRELTT